ncbi:enoyl-CoA hydratase/isomerase family protein [Hydrogenophilus thermoluteolus]|uniref:Enoyl-CoA hydratase n=1 Tax=Hydrogenophilus thermoluteolus TaxID=297 RepID=A0A2Z6DYC6_HYDTE|nr:enoyl-CoA hydratase-related protein [Hydrogenophilus thermoluteolus]BBD77265.1 enoyl-CoA hydratase [Hydrogenophilus thermoluteolus]
MKTYETLVITEKAPGVWALQLNRPESLNALSMQMLEELADAAGMLYDLPEVRALIIIGAGDHFMAGGDIRDFHRSLALSPETRKAQYRAVIERAANVLVERLTHAPFPVVSAVRGACAGFGLSLALMADLVVASRTAYFTTAYLNIGLSADGGMSYLLPRAVGAKRAARWLLLAERFSAEEALAAGAVSEIVADDQLEARVMEIATRWAHGPRHALLRMKRLLAESMEHTLEAQLLEEADAFSACSATEEFAEGVTAFLEKRPPRFPG